MSNIRNTCTVHAVCKNNRCTFYGTGPKYVQHTIANVDDITGRKCTMCTQPLVIKSVKYHG